MYKAHISFISIFIVGTVFGLAIQEFIPKQEQIEIRANDEDLYTFINPLLECANTNFEEMGNLEDLRAEVIDIIDSYTDQGLITDASVYYRDLNNGPWFAINEDEKFSPASLIKVPVMIAYYKEAELDPSILNKKILVTEPVNYDEQNFLPERTLQQGQEYTLQELIERSLIDSDNLAYRLLIRNIDAEKVNNVYEDLGINILKDAQEDPSGDIITVKDYSTFFRVLFNASYLDSEYSEKILSIMGQSNFPDGLESGLPNDTVVAHKYGERFYTFSGIHQLHDCGIVYNQRSPYLLCVMTRGNDFSQLGSLIQEATSAVDRHHSRLRED